MRRIPELAVAALLALSPAAAGAGGLRVVADPPALLLGEGTRATIRVHAPEAPRVAASAGRVVAVREVGPGEWAADYEPPPETYPQVAIVSATAGGASGWTVIGLTGVGDALVRTDPGAIIRVTIGEASFGPVRADARGIALVPVVVPPGVREAHHRRQKIDLRVPDVRHVHVALDREAAAADGASELVVRAFAVLPDGRPRRGAQLLLAASEGALSPGVEVEEGVVEARWALAAGAAGAASVTAVLGDEPGLEARATLQRPAGAPARLALELDRPELGVGERLAVRAALEDGAGNIAGRPLVVTASFGALRAAAGAGGWSGTLEVPDRREGRSFVEVEARGGGLTARRTVQLRSGPPATLSVDPEGGSLAGGRTVRLRVSALDAFGNPAAAPLSAEAEPGVVRVVPDGDGHALLYRGPRVTAPTAATLSLSAGEVRHVARYTVVRRRSELSGTLRGGAGPVLGGGFAPVAGADVLWLRARGAGHVGAGLDASILEVRRTERVTTAGHAFDLDGALRCVPLQLVAAWQAPLARGALRLAASAGVAHMLSRLAVRGQPASASSAWASALSAAASYARPAGPGALVGELRLQRLGDAGAGPIRGAAYLVAPTVGYRLDLY